VGAHIGNSSVPNRFKLLLLATVVIVSCNPMRGCPESKFILAPESRLPKWFSVPAWKSRSDLNVTLTYYIGGARGDDAVMELSDRSGHSLGSFSGQMCWHPAMHEKTNAEGGLDPDSFPHYVFVTVKGITEVLEHIRGPVFYVVDDQALKAQAIQSVSKVECRKEP
jgi:hypothetical protein